jgi:hypothetical protein
LENVIEAAIKWGNDTFVTELTSSPTWLRELLIQHWVTRANFSPIETNENSKNNAKVQVVAIASILMVYCGTLSEISADRDLRGSKGTSKMIKEKFDTDFLSDEVICNCICAQWITSIQ